MKNNWREQFGINIGQVFTDLELGTIDFPLAQQLIVKYVELMRTQQLEGLIDNIELPEGEGQITWDTAYEELHKAKQQLKDSWL